MFLTILNLNFREMKWEMVIIKNLLFVNVDEEKKAWRFIKFCYRNELKFSMVIKPKSSKIIKYL